MKKRIFWIGLLTLAFSSPLFSLTIEGVNVPAQTQINGQSLPLNGAGVRTVKLFVIPVKAYVAAFYAPAPLATWDALLASPGPLELTFTFLQSVGKAQVTESWQAQMQTSMTYKYAGLENDTQKFVSMFGAITKGEQQMLQFVGSNTLVYDSGSLKGTIEGRDFQKALLSVWFGSSPVTPELKYALLGSN